MRDDAGRPTLRERLFGRAARRDERLERVEEEPPTEVEVHEHIEVEEPVVEQPIEVHEHIELDEVTVPPEPTHRLAQLQLVERWRRFEFYQSFLDARRHRRFAAASTFVFGLAVLGVLAALVTGVPPISGLDAGQSLAVTAVLVLALGIVLSYGCALGNAVSLVLSWFAGLAGIAVAIAALPIEDAGYLVLDAVFGLMGLATLLSCTLALASWRGERVQRRMLGGPLPPA